MLIRTASPSERSIVEALQRRASLVWEEDRDALLAHPDATTIPAAQVEDGHVRVAVSDGRIVGFHVLLPSAEHVQELDGLFVEPQLMHGGIGRLLVADAVALARQRGAARVEVTANRRALGFYEKVGFTAMHTVATRFGSGIRMSRDLSASR